MPIGRTGKDGKAVVLVTAAQKAFGFADPAGREGLATRPAPAGRWPAPPVLQVQLAEPDWLRGQVVEKETRLPVDGAWVYMWGTGGPSVARSDRTGHFELRPPLSIHPDLVNAIKARYRQGSVALSATGGGSASELSLELEPAVRLEGRVSDAAGRPIGGAMVLATAGPEPFERLAELRRQPERRQLRAGGPAGRQPAGQGFCRLAGQPDCQKLPPRSARKRRSSSCSCRARPASRSKCSTSVASR